jgi:hypothetical protein
MVAFAGTGVTVRRSTICSSSVVATTSMHDRHRAWGVMVKLHIRSSCRYGRASEPIRLRVCHGEQRAAGELARRWCCQTDPCWRRSGVCPLSWTARSPRRRRFDAKEFARNEITPSTSGQPAGWPTLPWRRPPGLPKLVRADVTGSACLFGLVKAIVQHVPRLTQGLGVIAHLESPHDLDDPHHDQPHADN